MGEPADSERRTAAGGAPGDGPDSVVLYPIFASHSSRTFEIARDIAEGAGATLLVLDLYEHTDEFVGDSQHVAKDLLATHLDERHDVSVETHYERTDDPVEAVISAAAAYDTRLIIFDEHTPEPLFRSIGGDLPDRISDRVATDVVSVERVRSGGLDSILVPVAGGPHSGLAAAIAGAIARSTGATVDLCHVSEPGDSDAEVASLLESARDRLPADVAVDTQRIERADVAEALIEASGRYDLTVVGEPTTGRLQRFFFGSTTDAVETAAETTVLVSRRSNGEPFSC